MLVVVVVVFPNWRFLCFRTTFLCHRHSNPASQPVIAPTALSSTLATFGCLTFCQAFSVTVYHERYGFEWVFFYPQTFFTLRSFTKIFGTVTQMQAGTPHPGSSVPALTELSLSADAWT